jgi:hypothetical protein
LIGWFTPLNQPIGSQIDHSLLFEPKPSGCFLPSLAERNISSDALPSAKPWTYAEPSQKARRFVFWGQAVSQMVCAALLAPRFLKFDF